MYQISMLIPRGCLMEEDGKGNLVTISINVGIDKRTYRDSQAA